MSEIIYKRPGYGTRGITWNSLKNNFISRKSCIYSRFQIMYRFREGNGKYICWISHINYTFYFDTAKDLGQYIFNKIPKIFKNCEMCKLGYFNIDEKILKTEYNGYYTCKTKEKFPSSSDKYCHSCTSWNKDSSIEIMNLPKEFGKMLPDDITQMIDTKLKSLDFVCKYCFENVYVDKKIKGRSMYAFNAYGGDHCFSGTCWSCYKTQHQN